MLHRFNAWLARSEQWLLTGLLLLMIFVAAIVALLRNLSLHGLTGDADISELLHVGDFIVQKGNLWLAFLGASLAAFANRHIRIDVVPRLLPESVRPLVARGVDFATAVLCLVLCWSFLQGACIAGDELRPDYVVLEDGGSVQLCDARQSSLVEADRSRPWFCAMRTAIHGTFGVWFNSSEALSLLVVPFAFLMIALRLLLSLLPGKPEPGDDPHEVEGRLAP